MQSYFPEKSKLWLIYCLVYQEIVKLSKVFHKISKKLKILKNV